jgi:hypothetical protein
MSDAAEVKAEDGEVKAEVKSEDALPGDEHLKETTREILKAADLESVTKKTVRRSLEAKLGQWHAHAAPLVSSRMRHMLVATPAGGRPRNGGCAQRHEHHVASVCLGFGNEVGIC